MNPDTERHHVRLTTVGKPRFHGERARAVRKARGLSAREVATRAGIHRRYYLRLERNERPNVSAINVAAIAFALETNLEYLLGLTDDPRPIADIFGTGETES